MTTLTTTRMLLAMVAVKVVMMTVLILVSSQERIAKMFRAFRRIAPVMKNEAALPMEA